MNGFTKSLKKSVTFLLIVSSFVLQAQTQVTIDQLIGINTRAKDPIKRINKFSFVRDYYDWASDVGYDADIVGGCPTAKIKWNPSLDGSVVYPYDYFYSSLYRKTVATLKGLAPEMRGLVNYNDCAILLEQKPLCNSAFTFSNCQYGNIQYPSAFNSNPNNPNDSQRQPVTYKEHAKWQTLFAARFGSTQYAPGSAYISNFVQPNLATDQSILTGLGVLTYLENENEPDKTWRDEGATALQLKIEGKSSWFFKQEQFAAMLSADYDGHGKSEDFAIPNVPNAYYGIKNADPSMKVVMAGLAGLRGGYIDTMLIWFRANRVQGIAGFNSGNKLPFDALNFHHYSSSTNKYVEEEYSTIYEDVFGGGHGICPEQDSLKERLSYLIFNIFNNSAEMRAELVTKEIWLSEFGYDTYGGCGENQSGVDIIPFGSLDQQSIQAQWLVRSILEIAAVSVNDDNNPNTPGITISKAIPFELRDEPQILTDPCRQFASSGLLTEDFRPKKSWYAVLSLQNILKGYKYQKSGNNTTNYGITVSPNNPVRLYKYVNESNPNNPSIIYAIWSPTGTGVSFSATLTIPNLTSATKISIEELDENGRRSSLPVSNGSVTVAVSEMPVFIKVNVSENDPVTLPISNLVAEQGCCDGVKLRWTNPPNCYARHQIYYEKKTSNTPMQLNISSARLFAENLDGCRNNATVTGLALNTAYRFWVVSVDATENVTISTPTDAFTANGTCNNCLINIPRSWITFPNTNSPSFCPDRVYQILDAEVVAQPNVCSQIPMEHPDSTGIVGYCNFPFSAVITFPTSMNIDAIYYHDVSGIGDFKIEYADCYCWWMPLMTVKTQPFNQWLTVANPIRKPVKQIKLTFYSEANLKKLFFCGSSTGASCDATYFGGVGNVTGLEVADITDKAATLKWNVAKQNVNDVTSLNATSYKIRYGQYKNATNNLIQPYSEVYVSTEQGEVKPTLRTINLLPLTTYYAEAWVSYPDGSFNCAGSSSESTVSAKTTFTTLEAKKEERASDTLTIEGRSATEISREVKVYPNPATESIMVEFAADVYTSCTLHTITGVQVYAAKVSNQSNQLNIATKQFNGWYILTLQSDKIPPKVVPVLIRNKD